MEMTARSRKHFAWITVGTALILALAAVQNAGDWHHGVIPIPHLAAMSPFVRNWLLTLLFPSLPIVALVQWLLPQIKQRSRQLRGFTVSCLLGLVVGIVTEALGATVLDLLILGGALRLAGSVIQLAAAAIYVAGVWRALTRSLHMSVADTLFRAGALWLFAACILHFSYILAAAMDIHLEFLQRASFCVDISLLMGFGLNSVLGIFTVFMPHFLQMQSPDPRSINVIITFNVILAAWVGGAAWSLQYPYTWVRLLLSVVSLAVGGGMLHLVFRLRANEWVSATPDNTRQLIAKIALLVVSISAVSAAVVIMGFGLWLGATDAVGAENVEAVANRLLLIGVGSFGLLGIFVGLLGPFAGRRAVAWMAYAAMLALALGLLTRTLTALGAPLTSYQFTHENLFGQIALGTGHAIFALWLLSSTHFKRTT
ncbi:MAG: hypothetical protein ACLFWB_10070 [Armatimonadota bacterium]